MIMISVDSTEELVAASKIEDTWRKEMREQGENVEWLVRKLCQLLAKREQFEEEAEATQ